MKRLLNKLFSHTFVDRKWYQVIFWWEIRRIVFNLVLLFCGFISLIIFLFILKFDADIIHPFTPIAFGMLANLFYTFGWIIELFYRLINKQKSNSWGILSFKIGLGFWAFLTFLPTLLFGLFGYKNGEKFSSPYSHFTTVKPEFNQLIGTYQLDTNKSYLNIVQSDKIKEIKIALNHDSTFEMTNIPIFGFHNSDKYELCSGNGTWKLDNRISSDSSWYVIVHFDTILNENKIKPFEDNFFTNEINIYVDSPKVKLYQIIGDPDEWTGALYTKKE